MKFIGFIPLIATAEIEIDAENEDEAMGKLYEMCDRNEVDFNGYDPEHSGTWWVERKD